MASSSYRIKIGTITTTLSHVLVDDLVKIPALKAEIVNYEPTGIIADLEQRHILRRVEQQQPYVLSVYRF
ncbi:hypothetical protein PN36_15110 [Candidatus Thiomargarita nelsonii]|uniref:Uncharacterized protein n=1 Tax=Candidatus Thiomargarita nelsonii TaxID=1003181 RepID=A0A0A6PLT2_9GAMM|nr:hypothetical protein PN36_15110 [Candidatus Thiomargarita nelsonii]